jgi:hypothetical protein
MIFPLPAAVMAEYFDLDVSLMSMINDFYARRQAKATIVNKRKETNRMKFHSVKKLTGFNQVSRTINHNSHRQ